MRASKSDFLGLFEYPAQELERGRPAPVVEIDPGHQLDPGPSVVGGPAHAGHQAVVELEHRSGQTGAIERQIGLLVGPDGAAGGQIGQRLGGGQNAVTVSERRPERIEILGVRLDGHHPPCPVIGRQNQSRQGKRSPGRCCHLTLHANPDKAKTTLATAEKSSRP